MKLKVDLQEPVQLLRVGLFFILIVMLCTIVVAVSDVTQLLLLVAGMASLAVISAPIFLRSNYNIIEPPTFILLLVIIGVPLKLFYLSLKHGQNDPVVHKLMMGGDMPGFLFGTGVLVTGLACLVAGYSLHTPAFDMRKLYVTRMTHWRPKRLQTLSILLLGVSGLAFVAFVVMTGVQVTSFADLSAKRFGGIEGGSWSRLESGAYYVYRVACLSKYAFYMLLTWMIITKKKLRSTAGLFLFIAAIYGLFVPFFFSNRAGLFVMLIDAVVLIYIIKGRIRVATIALYLSVPLMLFMAASAVRGGGSIPLVAQAVSDRHFVDVTKNAHVINAIPDHIDYMYGETLVGWIFAPVPRSVWPDKPMSSSTELGKFIGWQVFGQSASGVPPGLVAELYLNFGWFGVIPGMFIMGLILRTLYRSFQAGATNPNIVLIYTLTVSRFTVFGINNDFGTGVIKTMLDIIPLCLCILYVGRIPSTQSASQTGRAPRGLPVALNTRPSG